jgi:hypothetical protein
MLHLAGSGVPGFLGGAPRTAKLLARSALFANTGIPLIDYPVMNALLAIVIELSQLILHFKPPLAEWGNSCPQPRPIICLYRDLHRRHHASIGSSKLAATMWWLCKLYS